jgi:hypothetical protein
MTWKWLTWIWKGGHFITHQRNASQNLSETPLVPIGRVAIKTPHGKQQVLVERGRDWRSDEIITHCICSGKRFLKTLKTVGCQWLTPVILATQEAEISTVSVRSQLGQTVWETLPQKNPSHKRGWRSDSRCRPWVQTPVLQKRKKKTLQISQALWNTPVISALRKLR